MTSRQVEAAKYAVENGGNISRAMRDAGYSLVTAKNPSKLTKSRGWQDLMDEYLPDKFLLETLAEDIKYYPETRKYSLTLAFKLKGRLDGKNDPYSRNFINLALTNSYGSFQADKYLEP